MSSRVPRAGSRRRWEQWDALSVTRSVLETSLLLSISPVASGQGKGKEGMLFCQGQNVKTHGFFCLNEVEKTDCIGEAAPFAASSAGPRDPPPGKQSSVLQMGAHLLAVTGGAKSCT